MEVHGYTQTGFIDATIDGIRMTIPDDMSNRIRQMIAVWEASGNVIPPYLEISSNEITANQINIEKDNRINSGFIFQGKLYQSDVSSRENIAGAFSMATQAIAQGALTGNYLWQKLVDYSIDTPFTWITSNNEIVPMDAQTVVQFGYSALAYKQKLIFKAYALKSMNPIPTDYMDDKYWT